MLKTIHAYTEPGPSMPPFVSINTSAAAAPPPGAAPDIAFALDLLAELGLVKRNGFELRITGAGMLAWEQAQA